MTTYRGIGTTDVLGQVTGATITEEVQLGSAGVGNTVFTLTTETFTIGADNLAVYINGVRQAKSAYTESASDPLQPTVGDTVTLSEAIGDTDSVAFIIGEIITTGEKVNNANLIYYDDLNSNLVTVEAQLDKLSHGINPIVVASLPAAASNQGVRYFVTDATATTFASTVAGGGSNIVPVYSDGTNWKIG